MKLSQISKLYKQYSNIQLDKLTPEERRGVLKNLGIDVYNFYQEIEMDYTHVQAHEDISYSEDVVGLHSHTYYEIIFIRSGNLQYLLGTKRYRLRRGDILIIPPGVSHQPLFLEKLIEPYDRYVLWLSDDFIKLLNSINIDKQPVDPVILRTSSLHNDAISEFEKMFRKGVNESLRQDAGWQTALIANTLSLLVLIRRAFLNNGIPLPKPEKQELIDEIMSYVDDNLSKQITIKNTARHFLVSESTISQLFAKRLNVSFYKFVTQRRLIAAKELILNDEPINEVASKVGFNDYSSFYRAFKSQLGISPATYKKTIAN